MVLTNALHNLDDRRQGALQMSINWERRRTSLRVLFALNNTNATKIALAAGLSPNTVSKFMNKSTDTLSSRSLSQILPIVGLKDPTELDTDNVIGDKKIAIRRVLDRLNEQQLVALHSELTARFGDPKTSK